MPDSLSSDCQGLLRRLLHPDPAQRIKMDGVLRHPWFVTGVLRWLRWLRRLTGIMQS
jgi:serine/threonine protein kinase